eukprot:3465637-Prorocentrum_lima.AAC.1
MACRYNPESVPFVWRRCPLLGLPDVASPTELSCCPLSTQGVVCEVLSSVSPTALSLLLGVATS